MAKIDLSVIPERLGRSVKRARERNIVIPTFKQMMNPAAAPARITVGRSATSLFDVNQFMEDGR